MTLPSPCSADGRLLAGIYQGLSMTSDNGCNFAFEPAIGIQNIADVSVEKGNPARALALASTSDAMGGFSTRGLAHDGLRIRRFEQRLRLSRASRATGLAGFALHPCCVGGRWVCALVYTRSAGFTVTG